MGTQSKRGSFRGSKNGNTRDRKNPAASISKEERLERLAKKKTTANHVGTSSLVVGDKAAPVDDMQERRRQIHANEAAAAKAPATNLTPAAAALLASLRAPNQS